MKQPGDLLNAVERRQKSVEILTEELSQVVLKLNYHFHSGYEHNDLRKPESIFMNFFKKQPSIIHSSYLIRLKNRDFRLQFDEDRYVQNIRFTDVAYECYHGLTDAIALLNDACAKLDYASLKENTNTMEKYLQIADKDIQFLNEFKFS